MFTIIMAVGTATGFFLIYQGLRTEAEPDLPQPGHAAALARDHRLNEPTAYTPSAARQAIAQFGKQRPGQSHNENRHGADAAKANDYIIDYTNAGGAQTRRAIRIYRVDPGRPCYVHALCMMAGELRTFRSDRIMEMVHCQTGEVIQDPDRELAARFPQKPMGAELEPEHVLGKAMEPLSVLIWVAQGDSEVTPAEFRNLTAFTAKFLETADFDLSPDRRLISGAISKLVRRKIDAPPDGLAFNGASEQAKILGHYLALLAEKSFEGKRRARLLIDQGLFGLNRNV